MMPSVLASAPASSFTLMPRRIILRLRPVRRAEVLPPADSSVTVLLQAEGVDATSCNERIDTTDRPRCRGTAPNTGTEDAVPWRSREDCQDAECTAFRPAKSRSADLLLICEENGTVIVGVPQEERA